MYLYIYNLFTPYRNLILRQGCLQSLGDRHKLALEIIAGQNYQLTW